MTTASVAEKPKTSPAEAVRLLLGGRTTQIPGFTNIDLYEGEGPDIRTDVSDLSMIKDGSVEEIYASHLLEHFPHVRTQEVLTEWNRVLRKGGRLYVSVPDFDTAVKLYQKTGMTDWIRNWLYGDQIYDLAYHYTAFTYPTLAAVCVRSGFSDVRRIEEMPHGLSDCSTNVDTLTLQSVSIHIEALK